MLGRHFLRNFSSSCIWRFSILLTQTVFARDRFRESSGTDGIRTPSPGTHLSPWGTGFRFRPASGSTMLGWRPGFPSFLRHRRGIHSRMRHTCSESTYSILALLLLLYSSPQCSISQIKHTNVQCLLSTVIKMAKNRWTRKRDNKLEQRGALQARSTAHCGA